MRALPYLFLILAPVISAAADTRIDDREQALVAAVDARYLESIELLRETVNINSGTHNFDGVKQVGQRFITEFAALGFEAEWQSGDAFGRAGHVIAKRHRTGPRILFIGHLDTVFPEDSSFQSFEMTGPDTARGPGVTDMKGGNVVMLETLRALREIDAIDAMSFTVVLTGDEETVGEPLALARKSLVDAARWADIAIGFEDGDSNPETVVISRRGSIDWELTVTGQAAHSSQIFQPEVGDGAIFEAARILNTFREQLSGEALLTVNPGIIAGGSELEYETGKGGSTSGKPNVIARTLRASGDLRTISPEQLENAQQAMQAIVADALPHTSSTLSFAAGYPPMAASEGNRKLLDLFDEVSRDLGFGPVQAVDPRNAGAADVSFAAEHVDMAIDGVGLMGSGGHTVDETGDLRTLPMQAKRVATLLLRLSMRED